MWGMVLGKGRRLLEVVMMNITKFNKVVKKYKQCPQCGASWKGHDMTIELENEVIKIACTCGLKKYVDENNKEVINN